MKRKYIDCFNIKKNRYLIYEDSRVYDTKKERFKTTHSDKDGYLYISFELNDKQHKKFRLNRIVCQCFHPIKNPENFEANHKNGIVDDNDADNLEWLTTIENIHHSMYVLNHLRIGDSHGRCKYSDDLVEDICRSLAKGKFRAKDIIEDIEERNSEYIINIEPVTFQNMIISIRQGKTRRSVSSKYNIPKMSLKDYRGLFWDSSTIKEIKNLINSNYSNREICLKLFNDASKRNIDYVYRIRKGAFPCI